MKYIFNLIPVIVFSVLALVVVIPLISPGYILTMDQVIAPKISLPDLSSPSFLYSMTLFLSNIILPSYFIQKIILILIFFLSGWGMYRFLPARLGIARYFGGIFYAINPFVYERIMAGQWGLLLGYSIIPLIITSISNFFDNPAFGKTVKLALIFTIFVNTSTHFILIFFALFSVYGLIYFLFNIGNYNTDVLLRNSLILGLLVIILNINWILPIFFGNSVLKSAIDGFTRDDLTIFQSVPDKNLGLIFNLTSGFGFWPEVYDYFISPKNIIFFWPLISLVIMGISLWGLVTILKEKERSNYPFLIALIIIFLLSLDLAGGVALKSFADITYFLYDKLPILRGFREPQKLVGIIMLCYAYFGSIGLDSLLNKVKKSFLFIVLCSLFFVLPFIYTPTIFAGFWGQLKPVFYPDSWQKVNQILKEDKDDFLTLFFPWNQYLRFNFTNNMVVANPAPYYFEKPILSSQNYETSYLFTHDIRAEAMHIEGLLSIEKEGVNLLGDNVWEKPSWGKDLSPVNVKYIILSKDEDWKKYAFLNRTPDLEKILEEKDLVLYKNKLFGQEITYPEDYTSDELPPVTGEMINN